MSVAGYQICTVTLDNPGSPVTVLSRTSQEMTHARFSPDGTRLTYTLFLNGSEDGGPLNTEIHVCNIDGSSDSVIVPGVSTAVNEDSSWLDNNNLIYSSTDATGAGLLKTVNVTTLATQTIQTGSLPGSVGDPSFASGLLCYTVNEASSQPLYLASLSGTSLARNHQLTSPAVNQFDYDPRISPDGSHVAFMRRVGTSLSFALYLSEVAQQRQGAELCLTPSSLALAAVPEWNSQGDCLVYRYVNGNGTAFILDSSQGLWVMNVNTLATQQVALPRGPLFNYPSFKPSGTVPCLDQPSIVYAARIISPPLP